MRLVDQVLNFRLFQWQIRQSRISFELTVEFNFVRRPNSKQLPHYVTSYMHHTGKKRE